MDRMNRDRHGGFAIDDTDATRHRHHLEGSIAALRHPGTRPRDLDPGESTLRPDLALVDPVREGGIRDRANDLIAPLHPAHEPSADGHLEEGHDHPPGQATESTR